MARPATSRLKVNPPLGRMPVLQFCAPDELQVDAAYQRSTEGEGSQSLIRRLAMFWNWDLCLPLVISRRRSETGEALFVIDGQHRLEAAKLRGDIVQLPCMVKEYTSPADEAASFVHLNQQRRPLTKLDLFKAAVASEDPEACSIVAAMIEAGLSVAPHSNYTAWKPGMVSNIGGIENAWRSHGERVTAAALGVMAEAFAGQVLRYAGTIFPGIAAVVRDEVDKRTEGSQNRRPHLIAMIGSKSQDDWRRAIMRARSDNPNLKFASASAEVLREHWARKFGFFSDPLPAAPPKPVQPLQRVIDVPRKPAPGAEGGVSRAFRADHEGKAWCDQCDQRRTVGQVQSCADGFCPMRLANVA